MIINIVTNLSSTCEALNYVMDFQRITLPPSNDLSEAYGIVKIEFRKSSSRTVGQKGSLEGQYIQNT